MPIWVPNAITIARLIAVPIFVLLLLGGNKEAAVWVFFAAGLSDALDGFLAKRFDAASELGAYLDPIADKALLLATFVTLGWLGQVPLWLVAAVVLRDIVIVGGALLYLKITQALTMEPLAVSKLNTALQIGLAAVVLARLGLDWVAGPLEAVLIYATAATTLVSGAAYVWVWGRRYVNIEQEKGQ